MPTKEQIANTKRSNEKIQKALQLIADEIDRQYASRADFKKEYELRYDDTISEASISSIRQGKNNISIRYLVNISEMLGINPFTEISDHDAIAVKPSDKYEDVFLHHLTDPSRAFITNANHRLFHGYVGTYHLYFFQTISQKDSLLEWELKIKEAEKGNYLQARLILKSPIRNAHDQLVQKEYDGYIICSDITKTVVCPLFSAKLGEICMLNFNHFALQDDDLACRMAVAITSSAGNPRLPTVHRAFLCRKKLTLKEQELLKGHLMMNRAEFLVSKTNLEIFLENSQLPTVFRQALSSALEGETYLKIQESSLFETPAHPSLQEINALSRLHTVSELPRYNKINRRSDEYTYEFYKSLKKPKAVHKKKAVKKEPDISG